MYLNISISTIIVWIGDRKPRLHTVYVWTLKAKCKEFIMNFSFLSPINTEIHIKIWQGAIWGVSETNSTRNWKMFKTKRHRSQFYSNNFVRVIFHDITWDLRVGSSVHDLRDNGAASAMGFDFSKVNSPSRQSSLCIMATKYVYFKFRKL